MNLCILLLQNLQIKLMFDELFMLCETTGPKLVCSIIITMEGLFHTYSLLFTIVLA